MLRQKQSTTFREKRHSFRPLNSIPIHPGIRIFYTNINLTQKIGFERFNLAVYWKRKDRTKQEDKARAAKLSAVRRRKALLHAVFINQFA